MDWTQDVVIDDVSAYLATVTKETTGGKVWEAARRLLEYFYRERHLLFAQPAQRILELGSGTGWLGMTLAQNLPAQMIWLTETVDDHALVWLQQQVDRNRDAGRSLPNLEVRACDWSWFARPGESSAGHAAEGVGSGDGAAATLRAEHWDLILGSDLLYHEIGVRSLPRVLSALSTPRTRIFYAHTMYRFENFDRDFFSELLKVGLQYRRVWPTLAPWAGEEEDDGSTGDGPSPGGLSEGGLNENGGCAPTPCGWGQDTMDGFDLFPEKQVQIFEMRTRRLRPSASIL